MHCRRVRRVGLLAAFLETRTTCGMILQPLNIGLHVAHGPEESLKPKSPQQLLRIDVAQKRADQVARAASFAADGFRPYPIARLFNEKGGLPRTDLALGGCLKCRAH